MRALLVVVCLLAVGVAVWWFVGSQSADPVYVESLPPPAPPSYDVPPIPDPSSVTPKPGVTATRRTPDAAMRLPIDVEVAADVGDLPRQVEVRWAREEGANRFQRMDWSQPSTTIYVELGDLWVWAASGAKDERTSKPVHVFVERAGPRPTVRLVLESK